MMAMILLTFKDAFNAFLKNNAIFLALGVIGLIILVFFLVILLNRKKEK